MQISYFPFSDLNAFEMRNNLIISRWLAEKVVNNSRIQKEIDDYNSLSIERKKFLDAILIFFFYGDGTIGDAIINHVANIDCKTRKSYEIHKLANEDIHDEVYSRLLNIFKTDHEIKKLAENPFQFEFVKKKIEWCEKAIKINYDLAMIVMEGIFFSSSFGSIFWFKELGLFPMISEANSYIARDEGLHTKADIYFLKNKPINSEFKNQVYKFFREGVEIEKFFVDTYCVNETTISPNLLKKHVEFVANELLKQMDLPILFETTETPFPYMLKFGLNVKFDFFKVKPTSYQEYREEKFQLDDDF